MLPRKHLWLALICVAIADCSGAPTSDSFISQYCDAFSTCCAQASLPTDGRQCRALFTAIAGIGGMYDPSAGEKCLAQVRSMSSALCNNMSSLTDCKGVYKTANSGTKAPGAPCSMDSDCAPSSEGSVTCAVGFTTMGAQTRTCQVRIVGKEGDMPCVETIDGNTSYGTIPTSSTGAVPPRGFTCNRADNLRCDSMTLKCTRIQDVGGPCTNNFSTFDSQCVAGAYCDTSQGKCAARKPIGSTCALSSNECDQSGYCDQMTMKCTVYIGNGGACTNDTSCMSQSCVNSKCAPNGINDLQLICGKAA
jgi:hypothetical protein